MKKSALKIVALVLVLACVGMVFAACGKKLSGTYTAEVIGTGTSYTFKGSKVTIEVKALGNTAISLEGKYSIKDNKITFTFESDDKDAKNYSGTQDFEELDNGDIKIGVVTYKKK